ncbi:amidohydrolase family protein [Leifsonia kafniensis]|uniref:Amidohydrolase family protein n=1 Tax=Leifsonia kafniensis TaxID=475957 RepID=A0ABP7KHD4_9MICO
MSSHRTPSPSPRIDAHLHLWDRSVSDYAWLVPEFGAIYDDFTPVQAKTELDAAEMVGAVLVQAEDSLVDTQFMLDVASGHPWVLGVVGWVPLDDPDAAVQALDRWLAHPAFCGVRHLLNDDPRADFLDLPPVRTSLAELARRGLPFDVHDAWPRHLGQAERVAAELPELTLVIDHLAKPPRGRPDFGDWRQSMAAVARHPNTVAKLSALRRPDAPFTVDALREVWDFALEHFGPDRLMYGGDWPMTVAAGGYQPTWQVMSQLVGELSEAEQRAIVAGTASRVYGIRLPA